MLNIARTGREAGFTLIELVVAMAAGLVVILALSGILISVLHATQSTYSRIDATRQTRLALANVENELHSACVGTGTAQNLAPIEANSDQNTLRFVSYLGTAVNPTPVLHELQFTSATLTDTTYALSGTAGAWVTGARQGTTTLLQNVGLQGTIPFFQYFAYTSSPGPDGEDYWGIPGNHDTLPNGTTPPGGRQPTPLTAGLAASTVEVLITLDGGPTNPPAGAATPGTTDPETDAISLRLTTPPDEAPATSGPSYGPCE